MSSHPLSKWRFWAAKAESELEADNRILDLLTQIGAQCERAVIVQFLVASPAHRIAHSLDFNLGSKFQPFPICDVRKDELRLPNLARYRVTGV